MTRSQTSTMTAFVATICACWIAAASQAGPPDALGRGDTKKLLQAAEQHMAQFRLNNKLDKKKDAEGNRVANLVAHPDNPLNGKTCKLKVRFKALQTGTGHSDDDATQAEETIVVGEMKTKLRKFYSYSRLLNDLDRPLKSTFDEDVKNLRHEVFLHMPAGFKMPKKQPKNFRAVVHIRSVEWDHGVAMPHLIIHADPIESSILGIGDSDSGSDSNPGSDD